MLTPPRHILLLTMLALTAAMLPGCSELRVAGSSTRVYAADFTGAAKTCDAAKVVPLEGKPIEATMKLRNDGGWCALSVARGGKPYDSALLTGRASHGKVFIHRVGDETRIDYTPDRGYAGPDTFTVKLIPGDAVIEAAVTVTGGS